MAFRAFNEVFGGVTAEERAALVWHLAAYRARKTIEALIPNAGVTHASRRGGAADVAATLASSRDAATLNSEERDGGE